MKQNTILLIGFVHQTTEIDKSELHQKFGTKLITKFNEIDVDVIEIVNKELHNVVKDYQSSIHVAFVEENSVFSMASKNYDTFNHKTGHHPDGHFHRNWGLGKVNLKPAWNAARKIRQKVTIAILDTGIDPKHPDLSSKIVKPVNVTTKKRNEFQDENGHGTHVAGIAAAVTTIESSVSGHSLHIANIMPVKVIGPDGGKSKWIIAGILYAVLNGAKVINISIGGRPFSLAIQRAINFAWEKGAVIVSAAGNEGLNQVDYPAGYNFVLAVSATNKYNKRARFSNWGKNIGITAPGTSIYSTTPTYPTLNRLQYYDSLEGTSQATPFVSGLAALLFAIYPHLSNAEVIQKIQKAAVPIHDEIKQWNSYSGYGLLNAANAVNGKTGNSFHQTPSRHFLNSNNQISIKKAQVCKGCFYGQIVDQSGNPVANAIVSARISGKIVSMFKTGNQVLYENNRRGTDGMFRLHNLMPGEYNIFVELPDKPAVKLGSYTITGGADTILRLVYNT